MKGYGNAIGNLIFLFIVMIPLSLLGIWKLIEIVIWLFGHVQIV